MPSPSTSQPKSFVINGGTATLGAVPEGYPANVDCYLAVGEDVDLPQIQECGTPETEVKPGIVACFNLQQSNCYQLL